MTINNLGAEEIKKKHFGGPSPVKKKLEGLPLERPFGGEKIGEAIDISQGKNKFSSEFSSAPPPIING